MSGEQSGDVRKSETAQAGVGTQMPRDGSTPSAAHSPTLEEDAQAVRVLVCGGRNFNDMELLHRTLNALRCLHEFKEVIHGCALGADSMAGTWAKHKGIPVLEYPADWKKHGRAAGPRRNEQMLKEGKPDLVVAFPGGTGTAHMVRIARAAGVPVFDASIGRFDG